MKKTIECVVIYFNRCSGEGTVRAIADGSTAEIYACNIKGKKTWYPETACVYYCEGQVVQVHQDDNKFILGITPGEFDAEKWASLDQDRLAFKCNDEGEAINGLFAPGAGL